MKKKLLVFLLALTTLCTALLGSCKVIDDLESTLNGAFSEFESSINNESSASSEKESISESTSIPNLNVKPEEVPESLVFSLSGSEFGNTSEVNVQAGKTYNIDLVLKNESNTVADVFGDYKILKVAMQGKFKAIRTVYNLLGVAISTEEVVVDLEQGRVYVAKDLDYLNLDINYFFDAMIDGDSLVINAKHSDTSFDYEDTVSGFDVRLTYSGAYYDPRGGGQPSDVRFYVYVEDVVSGVRSLLYIDIV